MRAPLLAALAALLTACGGGGEDRCTSDEGCPLGRYCLLSTGECSYDCTQDLECAEGYTCGLRGRCVPGCRPSNGGVEICDDLDNDCDGATDEELGERACERQNAAGRCTGVERCVAGAWACDARVPRAETCDGLDNDCDGLTDNATPPACPLTQGVCAQGVRSCQGAAGWSDCQYPETYEPGGETRCDGLDNDCDGGVDVALPDLPCPLDQGVCAGVVQMCLAGSYTACLYGPFHESEELTCDGRDNDCDGEVDEGLEPNDSCEVGPLAHDGIDNNCDGLVDEPGGCVLPIPGRTTYIDRFESSVFQHSDCTGVRYGELADDYPATFPASTFLYACSLPTTRPSGYVNWEEARKACEFQGKRLCTRSEWIAACGGQQNQVFPYGDTFEAGTCVDFSVSEWAQATGSYPACVSPAGAFDMSGNLTEWVSDTCAWDATKRHLQGGSTSCDSDGQPCEADNPAHQEDILSRYSCGGPGVDSWCNEPTSTWFAHGIRCCWDGP